MTKLTVLVTDDDQAIRDGIEIYLKNEGYNVIKAADGVEALQKLQENEVHLIILDIKRFIWWYEDYKETLCRVHR